MAGKRLPRSCKTVQERKKETDKNPPKTTKQEKDIPDMKQRKPQVKSQVMSQLKIKNRKESSTPDAPIKTIQSSKKKVGKVSETELSFEDLENKIFEEPKSFRTPKSRQLRKRTEANLPNERKAPNIDCKNSHQNKTLAAQKNSGKRVPQNAQKGNLEKSKYFENCKESKKSLSKGKIEPTKYDNESLKNKASKTEKMKSFELKKSKTEKTKFLEAKPSTSKIKTQPASDSEESGMEEIDELDEIMNIGKSDARTSVQVELESKNILWGMTNRKKKSEQEKIQDYLRKEVNRSIKQVYENMHKTHILCLMARGRYINISMNSEEAMSNVLSVVPKAAYPNKRLDIKHLQRLLSWFTNKFDLEPNKKPKDSGQELPKILAERLQAKESFSEEETVILFVLICRVLGVSARFVMNLVPVSWKPPLRSLLKPPKKSSTPEPVITKQKVTKMNSQRLVTTEAENKKSASEKTKKNSRKVISSDSDEEAEIKSAKKRKISSKNDVREPASKKKKYFSFWAEVFCEEEEKWLSVDVPNNKVHLIPSFQSKLAPNSAYILAFKQDLSIKDVTKRYISSYLSCRDKWRLNNDWWMDSLKPFKGIATKRDKIEDAELDKFLETQPLPTTISAYKNHPMYALQRHLLKFEAIYPPDVSPVGYFKGEPVFPRENVKTLFGRDRWIKEGKTVIVGEEPYKIVTRLKWDKNTNTLLKDVPLEIFGDWQIEDYEPPSAANGKVPRNEYGNVELFKISMLPKGCVYMQLPGLNRVARKLGIDCATALTGFDFHGGWNHPVYDGFVVCTEFESTLKEAWEQEQVEIAKREEANRLRTIYGNWKKLIKGMLVREKIWDKYGDDILKEQHQIKQEKTRKKVEKSEKKKAPPKKKIKQEDISAIKPMVTHEVTDLRIDFDASAGDRKPKIEPASTSGTYSNLKIEEEDSSEEESQEIKQEKMRSILNWKPKNDGPNLSDDSGEESETDIPKVSTKPAKKVTKRETTPSDASLSEGSTSESDEEIQPKKRPRRSVKKVQLSSESEDFDDSDNDKDFQPSKKK